MLARLLRQIAGRLGSPQTRDARVIRLVESGRLDEAEDELRRALARSPADAHARHQLGLVCLQCGRVDEAIGHITSAIALESHAVFHSNLAQALRMGGRLEPAEAHAREAASLAPEVTDFALKLAGILAERLRTAESLQWTERVLARAPDDFDALMLAGRLHGHAHDWQPALECFRRALALRPGDPGAVAGAYRAGSWLCEWPRDDEALCRLLEDWAARPSDPAFEGLHPFIAYEVPVAQALRDVLAQAHADRILRRSGRPGRRFERKDKARLRIGYVSADYHNHPTMHLMRGLFPRHDRGRFEIFAYSLGPDDASGVRTEVAAAFDAFRDLAETSEADAAAAILADAIDILVDLKGFTHGSRPALFAARPAPLRVGWLGYPASTGRGLNDYMIVDRVVAPAACAPHFGEQLVWMPHSYQVNDDGQPIASVIPGREELGLPLAGTVFACFNHVYKIEPAIFSAWMRILARLPGSVLWLYSDDDRARANLRREARGRGIDPSRLVFAGTLDKARHLARLKQADLFLDTLRINAHTGASDALWAGLPVLTCPQEGFPSRVAASVVSAAELPGLICRDLADYEEKAVRLGGDRAALEQMRRHLETRHARLPLFDTARFTRHLESAYEIMWSRYLAGEPPASFEVEDR